MFDDRIGEEEEKGGGGVGIYGSCGTEISAQRGERKMEGRLQRGREKRKPSVKKNR